jgi:hypothetical protein
MMNYFPCCLIQRAIRDRDMARTASQFDVATESESDLLGDANGSENSAGEVCTCLTSITPCICVMCPLPALQLTGKIVWAYNKYSPFLGN